MPLAFTDPPNTLENALSSLSTAPLYNDPLWLKKGFEVWKSLGDPVDRISSQSIGIPTWFYGHEPPNVFATHIAKYFENSVREEGLLAIALGGIIFAEGNAGTVQELFQDACQNYYRTYQKVKSPMILLGVNYWNPTSMTFGDPTDKRKQVFQLLRKLSSEKGFEDYLHITDSVRDAVDFLVKHPPMK
ncbi:MAG: hypothetical protein IPM01_27980 [Burkholderiaceae bacterium]|nr:hypothetical protein [Burkholderiaceae bacterium]